MHVNVKKKKKESISHPSLRLRLLLFRPEAHCPRMTARDRCDLDRIEPQSDSNNKNSHSLLSRVAPVEYRTRTRSRIRTRHGMANSAIPRLARGQVTTVTTPRSLATRPLAAVADPRLTPSLLRLPSPIPTRTRTRTLQIRTGRRLRTPTRLRLVVVVVTTSQITGRLGWATTGTIRGVEGVLPGGLEESRTTTTVLFFVDVREEVRRRRPDPCALLVLATMTRTSMTTATGLPPLPLHSRIGRLPPPPPPRRRLRVAPPCSQRPTLHGPPPRAARWSALDPRHRFECLNIRLHRR